VSSDCVKFGSAAPISGFFYGGPLKGVKIDANVEPD
jgi:hypothetical protein